MSGKQILKVIHKKKQEVKHLEQERATKNKNNRLIKGN